MRRLLAMAQVRERSLIETGFRRLLRGILPTAIGFVAFATLSFAANPPVGEFVSEGGGGELTIRREKSALVFDLQETAVNVHVCSLGGRIREGVATIAQGPLGYTEGGPEDCKLEFTSTRRGIEVTIIDNFEACRAFCGARASFGGEYLRPAPGCAPSAVARARRGFRSAYDAKDFTQARRLLERVLARCTMLTLLDRGWIRNDVAIAQYRAGDLAACRRTLAPFEPDLVDLEDDLTNSSALFDALNWREVLKAARTNMRLCKYVPAAKPPAQ